MAVVRYVELGLIEFAAGLQLRALSDVMFVSTICVGELGDAFDLYSGLRVSPNGHNELRMLIDFCLFQKSHQF